MWVVPGSLWNKFWSCLSSTFLLGGGGGGLIRVDFQFPRWQTFICLNIFLLKLPVFLLLSCLRNFSDRDILLPHCLPFLSLMSDWTFPDFIPFRFWIYNYNLYILVRVRDILALVGMYSMRRIDLAYDLGKVYQHPLYKTFSRYYFK